MRAVGDWEISTHIGSGSFAIVWKARHRLTGQEAAIKEIALDKLNAKLRQSLESEVSILKRITHENIVKLLEVFEEKSKLYLIMEYCAGGDLAHYLRAQKRVPEATAQHFMQQLAAGLREMWAHHLVHRDLKPQNLLLEGPGPKARLKIADFGFARNLQPQGLAETLCGSPLYMAPEILHFHKYDAKADLWSVGAILFELVAGRPPFNGANQFQLLRNIERGEARLPDVVASQLSLPCRQLLHALLRRNPVERISFEEFFRHPFLTGPPVPPPPPGPFGAPPLGRSFSANSIPQQVLGFKQQQGQGLLEGGGAGLNAAAAPVGHTVVPPGELSNQLKPRRSLDLDGIAQRAQQLGDAREGLLSAAAALQQRDRAPPGAGASAAAQLGAPGGGSSREQERGGALVALLQQHQQQQPPPQQPLQNGQLAQQLGSGWGQPAGARPPPLPSQQPLILGQALTHAPLPTAFGSAPPAAGPAHPLAAAGARAPPTVLPSSSLPTTAPSMPAPPRLPSGAAAAAESAATAVQAAGTVGHASSHSSDEDYVLVDTSVLSSRSQQAVQQPSPGRPASPASVTTSLVNSLQGRPADEVFSVAASEDAAGVALAGAGAGGAGPWQQAEAEEEGPRWQALRRAANALEQLARGGRPELAAPPQQPAQCLSLCLAALQLLEHALDLLGSPAEAAAGPEEPPAQPDGPPAAKAAGWLRADVARVLALAQAAAGALSRQAAAAAAVAGGAAAEPGGGAPPNTLPDPWELCYYLSLGLAKEAAVDELLGNHERSLQLYSQACCLLHFLSTEGPALALEPPLQLAQQDRLRLLRYAAATSARCAACRAQLDGSGAGGEMAA